MPHKRPSAHARHRVFPPHATTSQMPFCSSDCVSLDMRGWFNRISAFWRKSSRGSKSSGTYLHGGIEAVDVIGCKASSQCHWKKPRKPDRRRPDPASFGVLLRCRQATGVVLFLFKLASWLRKGPRKASASTREPGHWVGGDERVLDSVCTVVFMRAARPTAFGRAVSCSRLHTTSSTMS
jgi:hypothetical protein